MKDYELLDAIGGIDSDFVKSADNSKSKHRSRVWKTAIPVAACLCLLIVGISVFNHNNGLLPSSEISQSDLPTGNDSTVISDDMNSSSPEQNTGGQVAGPMEDENHSQEYSTIPMISSYGESTYDSDMAVINGSYELSDSLKSALQEYNDTANYRVVVNLFEDGVQIDITSDVAQKEMSRLSQEGYIVAIEKYNDGYAEQTYFTLHATYDQLQDFSASSEFGYYIMLYGDCFATEDIQDDAYAGVFQPAE